MNFFTFISHVVSFQFKQSFFFSDYKTSEWALVAVSKESRAKNFYRTIKKEKEKKGEVGN